MSDISPEQESQFSVPGAGRYAPVVILEELLDFVKPFRDPIRFSGRLYAHEVETRMDISARHLSTAFLGRRLEPVWQANREKWDVILLTDHGTFDTAKTLAFGGAVAGLDLCASALLLWVGAALPPDWEFDMADLKTKKQSTGWWN